MRKYVFLIVLLAVFCSCEEIIEVDNISNLKVILLAPTEGAIIDTTHVDFHWENMENATQYQLQIATPSFAGATQIVLDTTIVDNYFSETLMNNSYEWRVRAINSGYESDYSTNSFVLQEE